MERTSEDLPCGVAQLLSFSFVEALLGRRSRRFFLGAQIPDGHFAYKSRYELMPLSRLEELLVVAACGSNTSWNHLIFRADRYAPYLSNYAASAGGRTFPSSAGFHTSQTFFSDDEGLFMLDARNALPFGERNKDGQMDVQCVVEELERHVREVYKGRVIIPPQVPYVEPHNTWVVNQPGTLLVIPVADLAQHMLLNLCYMLQNGLVLTDDINRRAIPGIGRFKRLVDTDKTWPLTFVEQWSMAEATAELSTSCYAGSLMLQAMGLGGWMFNGIDPFTVLGASGRADVPGLGFRYDTDERWPYPNPTGLKGVFEAFCPPHYPDMHAAVDAVVTRKFGPGGPFHPDTDGPWIESERVRSSAQVHSEEFKECVTLQAQYVFDTFGKFPGNVPSLFVITYLQAHHLDLEFYDKFFKPGAYLRTHTEHMETWHPNTEGRR